MKNPFIKFALAVSALTVLLLLTAATPPDRYPVHVTSSYVFTGGMSNIFSANTPAASNAWSQTFGSSNAVYLLTGRVANLEAVTNAFGDIITTDAADYATAAQGDKADTAVQPAALSAYVTKTQTALTNSSATVVFLDVGTNGYQVISLGTNIAFHSTNRAVGEVRSISLLLVAGNTNRTIVLDTNWMLYGVTTFTNTISSNKTAVLSLTCYGSAETNCLAAFAPQQ